MTEHKKYYQNKSVTEFDLLKSSNDLKEEIEEKFDKKLEKVEEQNAKADNTLVKVEVLLQNMSEETKEIRKEMKEDRIERKKEEEKNAKRHNELERQIQSVKLELNENVGNVEKRLSEEIKDLRLGLDNKLDIKDFEVKYKEIEKGAEGDDSPNKLIRNGVMLFITALSTPQVIIEIVHLFSK